MPNSSLANMKNMISTLNEKRGGPLEIKNRYEYGKAKVWGKHKVIIQFMDFNDASVLMIPTYILKFLANIDNPKEYGFYANVDNEVTKYFESISMIKIGNHTCPEKIVGPQDIVKIDYDYYFLPGAVVSQGDVLLLFKEDEDNEYPIESEIVTYGFTLGGRRRLLELNECSTYCEYIEQFSKCTRAYNCSGSWLRKLITGSFCLAGYSDICPVVESCHRCLAVALHVGSASVLPEILLEFDKIPFKWDLYCYVSKTEDSCESVSMINSIRNKTLDKTTIIVSECNKGFDIYGNLRNLENIYVSDRKYNMIYLVHTKSNNQWRREMMSALFDTPVIIAMNMRTFERRDDVGIIGSSLRVKETRDLYKYRYHMNFLTDNKFEETEDFSFVGGTIFAISRVFCDIMMGYYLSRREIIDMCFNDKNTVDLQYMHNLLTVSYPLSMMVTEPGDIDPEDYPEVPRNLFQNEDPRAARDFMFEHTYERFWGYLAKMHGLKLISI